MATVSITIPDAVVDRVLAAVCSQLHYIPDIHGTRVQFAKAQLAKWIKDIVKAYESAAAASAAGQAAAQSVEEQIIIT